MAGRTIIRDVARRSRPLIPTRHAAGLARKSTVVTSRNTSAVCLYDPLIDPGDDNVRVLISADLWSTAISRPLTTPAPYDGRHRGQVSSPTTVEPTSRRRCRQFSSRKIDNTTRERNSRRKRLAAKKQALLFIIHPLAAAASQANGLNYKADPLRAARPAHAIGLCIIHTDFERFLPSAPARCRFKRFVRLS